MWMGEWVVISLNGGWEGWFWNSCCLTDAQTPSPTPLGSVSKKPWELDVSLRWVGVWGGEGTGQAKGTFHWGMEVSGKQRDS